MTEFRNVRLVVLAGGSGTRLWPLSRLEAPKQFLRLLDDQTLLEATIGRLAPLIDESQVLVITNEKTAKGEGYLPLEPYEKILEPASRNTAPAIAIAALRYRLEGIDPVMVILPSDHVIRDVPAFQAVMVNAIEHASEGKLVTLGIPPTFPETGFGYIDAPAGGAIRRVRGFHEKPDLATAERYIASGDCYWNSGMFVWRASEILLEIKRALPDLFAVLEAIEREVKRTGDLGAAIDRHFADAPSVSIDQGVLEGCDRLYMLEGRFGWSDVGNWDAVYEAAEKDAQSNVIQGNVVAIDCRNTLIRSHKRLVAAVDLENVSIVETADAVLVTRRGASQNVRKIVEELTRRSASEHILHMTVQRPWGSYTVLEEGPCFKIKRIEVSPGGRLSLQSHAHRSEHWVVIEGTARVTCGDRTYDLKPNESTFVPIGARHRLENPGQELLQMIEVQVGDQVDEADIVRYDDQYGR